MNDLYGTVRVASPCRANWNDMTGDERSRFCSQCQKHVYNLSALTAEAAADLIRAKEGKFCARFYQREDGTLIHAVDCPVGFAARQWRRMKNWAGAVASLLLLVLGANRAQAGDKPSDKKPAPQPPEAPYTTMGEICVLPSPTPSASPTPKPTPLPPKKPGEKP